jgi:hypothetical protein
MGSEDFQQQLEEEEQSLSETLRKVYRAMVLCGDLNKSEFDFLVYRTGVREKFNS